MRDIVVISAFSCDPNIPSEPTVGWTYLRTWMKIATSSEAIEVMAIMSQSSKLATDAQILLVDPTAANYSTVAIELPRVARILEKSQHLTRFEYLLWCFLTRRYLRKQSKSRNIILARHVT